jgi:hypothetical protein
LKEIKQIVNESVWDYDQRFKILKYQLTFHIPDEQHREWFIVGLFSHICFPLTTEYCDAVRSSGNCDEIGSASPVGENNVGMAQVQSHWLH